MEKKSNLLTIKFAGQSFQTPLLAGAGVFGYGDQLIDWDDLNRWGGVVLKGLTLKPCAGNPHPRIFKSQYGLVNSIGLRNPGWTAFMQSYHKQLPLLKTHITVNISGTTEAELVQLAREADQAPFGTMIELNLSCPNIANNHLNFATNPASAFKIVQAVKNVVRHKLLIVKLTSQVSDLKAIAKQVELAGADAISLINTVPAMVIDAEHQTPYLGGRKGGLSGPAIKFIALKAVYDVYEAVKIPIIGIGGIQSGIDCVEFLLAGATLVQIGTALYNNPLIRRDLEKTITAYLTKHKISSVSDLIGRAHIQHE